MKAFTGRSIHRKSALPRVRPQRRSGSPPNVPPKHPRHTAEDDDRGKNDGQIRSRWLLAASAAAATTLAAPPAHAGDDVAKYVDSLMATYGEALTSLGFSGLMGYCAGKVVRMASILVAVIVGVGFVSIQIAAANGTKLVDWDKMDRKFNKLLDTNRDGRFTSADTRRHLNSFMSMLTDGVPSVAGFLVGFALGLK